MRKLTVTSQGVVLPSATDIVSLSAIVASIVSFAIGIVSLLHPNLFGAQESIAVQATVPLLSIGIAAVIQVVNIWRNATVKKAAIARDQLLRVMTRLEYQGCFGSESIQRKANAKIAIKK